jgi:hypothetical protein
MSVWLLIEKIYYQRKKKTCCVMTLPGSSARIQSPLTGVKASFKVGIEVWLMGAMTHTHL